MTAALAAFTLIPWVRENPRLAGSVWGAVGVLVVLTAAVQAHAARAGRVLRYEFVHRPVHYVQLAMHTSIYAYWGWYWREVYHYYPLILAQIAFFYALDMLVCWWRSDRWILGFGPFPIVFSTNLFLWFRDDWFYLQFAMIATAVLCKAFLTWERDGRRTHIFNPSAIALAIFSVGLLATHNTGISWAEEVSVSLGRPPYMYFWIFATGMVVQSLFSVTLVTLSAAAALVALNLAYTAATGVYYFVDATIPIAVFLGLHLLVTDPATSPKRNLGKVMFGALYGTAVFALYAVLGRLGLPTFYDKLLCVPLMNLTVRWLDRVSGERRWGSNPVHMAVWIALFVGVWSAGLLGSSHPGSHSEFWRQACVEGRHGACATWVRMMNVACVHGSGNSCYQMARAMEGGLPVVRDAVVEGKSLARACDAKVAGACPDLVALVRRDGDGVFTVSCAGGDGESCFVMGSLYYARGGVERASAMFLKACDAGWARGCGGLGEIYRGTARATEYFEKACKGGIAASCYAMGDAKKACELSLKAVTDNAAFFRAGVKVGEAAYCGK